MAEPAVFLESETEVFDFLSDMAPELDSESEIEASYRGLNFTYVGIRGSRSIDVEGVDGALGYTDTLSSRIQVVRELTFLADIADERIRRSHR